MILYYEHHCCWWLSDTKSQTTNNHGTATFLCEFKSWTVKHLHSSFLHQICTRQCLGRNVTACLSNNAFIYKLSYHHARSKNKMHAKTSPWLRCINLSWNMCQIYGSFGFLCCKIKQTRHCIGSMTEYAIRTSDIMYISSVNYSFYSFC